MNSEIGDIKPTGDARAEPFSRQHAAALGALTLLALGLRLYRFTDLPVWVDEEQIMGYLGAPDLATFLSFVRFVSPDHVPGYFVIQFFWSRIAGTSPEAIRMLSVILSTLCVPLLMLLGRRLYSWRAGLIAALLFAISPIHIWYGQSARYNALVIFLALISLLSLLEATHSARWRWWVVNILVNAALLWIHLLTSTLMMVELLYLLLIHWRKFRQIVVWGAVLFVILAAALLWLRASAPYLASIEEDHYDISSLDVLVDLLGDDAITLSQSWMFGTSDNPYVPKSPHQAFMEGSFIGWINRLLMIIFAGSVLVVVARSWWDWRASARRPYAPSNDEVQGRTVLLLLLAFAPVTALVILSQLVRPVLIPAYTLYSSLALYLFVGAALTFLRVTLLRAIAGGLLLAIYGYQLMVMLPETTRTDWLSAAREVRAYASPEDAVLVRGRWFFATETFRFAFRGAPNPILSAYTLQSICDKASRYLNDQPARSLWVVIEVAFDYPRLPLETFERCLNSRGLEYSRTFYPGIGGVAVYRIRRVAAAPAAAPPSPEDMPVTLDLAQLLREMGVAPEPATLDRLRRVIEVTPPLGAFTWAQFSLTLSDEGCLDLAEAAARTAISFTPESSFGHFALAVAFGEARKAPEAKAAFAKVLELDHIGMFRFYEPLFRTVYLNPDPVTASATCTKLDGWGAYIPQSLRAAAGDLPLAPALRACR